MPKKRFNIWMETSLIRQIKAEAKRIHLNHLSTYVRVAALEKMERDQRERATAGDPTQVCTVPTAQTH